MLDEPTVKVCGLTCSADVDVALEAGAQALGFVHHLPSPRHLDAAAAAVLAARAPADVWTVAVLVDAERDRAEEHVRASGARAIQLCGSEEAQDWRGFPVPVLRRIPVARGAEQELERWRDVAAGFVLDHPAAPGGSGRAVDEELAASLARAAPCLLAGGLDGDNVAARVARVRPVGVDASSRLERAPGAKDHDAVRAFVRAARAALGGLHGERGGAGRRQGGEQRT